MSVWEIFVTTLAVLASVVTLVLLYRSVGRNPVRDVQELSATYSVADTAPGEVRSLLRSQLLEATATRYYAPPVGSWMLQFSIWLIIVLLATALSPASTIRKSVVGAAMVALFLAIIWAATRTDIYRKRRRAHDLLLAMSRNELEDFVETHKELDVRTPEERKYEAIQSRISEWVRTTKGAREIMLLLWLALLVGGLLAMASDLGWL